MAVYGVPKTPTRDGPLPNRIKSGKVSAADMMNGLDEKSYGVDYVPQGSRESNSARPRDASKASFVDGCFCNKRGQ